MKQTSHHLTPIQPFNLSHATTANMERPSQYIVTPLVAATPVPKHLLHKFKALRLDALRSDPASFTTNYEHELRFSDDDWERWVTGHKQHHMICEYVAPQTGHLEARHLQQATSMEREWVGMFTLRGPLSQEQYSIKARHGPDLGSDEDETRWSIANLHVQSKHRGTEMMAAIHEAVLDLLRLWTDDILETLFDETTGLEKPKRARIGGAVQTQHPTLTSMYQALGAYEVGDVDRAEARRIRGSDAVVGVHGGEKDTGRMVAMERVIDC